MKELDHAIAALKAGRCKDGSGIVAEMIKEGGPKVREVLLDLYNEVLQKNAKPPTSWREVAIKVLYKSGDPQQPQNYRPIAIIPILYKLFSKLLYNRLEPILDVCQSEDQAGFRKKFSTDDHLMTMTLIQEFAHEWNVPLWVSALDFKKAFDMVSHGSLWKALQEQGVHSGYVNLIKKLYSDQHGIVKTDVTSKLFSIQRGVKQGDPLSSLLFNCISESMMRRLKDKWSKSIKYGINLCPHAGWLLTNLRFADDVLLFAPSFHSISEMIADMNEEANKHGLQLHPDKTKILHNGKGQRRVPPRAIIEDMQIEVLAPTGSTKYLGRNLTFSNPTSTEIDNRISVGWRKFRSLKSVLSSRSFSLNDRLR